MKGKNEAELDALEILEIPRVFSDNFMCALAYIGALRAEINKLEAELEDAQRYPISNLIRANEEGKNEDE